MHMSIFLLNNAFNIHILFVRICANSIQAGVCGCNKQYTPTYTNSYYMQLQVSMYFYLYIYIYMFA